MGGESGSGGRMANVMRSEFGASAITPSGKLNKNISIRTANARAKKRGLTGRFGPDRYMR